MPDVSARAIRISTAVERGATLPPIRRREFQRRFGSIDRQSLIELPDQRRRRQGQAITRGAQFSLQ